MNIQELLKKPDEELERYSRQHLPKIHREATASIGFKITYRDDFCAFVHDCIDLGYDKPTEYQDEILSDITIKRKVAVRGPHGIGKTTLAAWIVLAFSLTRDGEDWKIPTTASAWRQLTLFLWPEIHKWARKIRWDRVGRPQFDPFTELLKQKLILETGQAFAMASNLPEKIEGAHADQGIYIFDEAKIIPDDTWDSAEGAFASGDWLAFAISTPGEKTGRFYEIHARRAGLTSWHTRHVTLEEYIKSGRINEQWAEDAKELWGENSEIYRARVLGEFSDQSAESLFKLSDIEYARENETDVNFGARKHAALDVATSGDDDSVYGQRIGDAVILCVAIHGNDTMALVGLIRNGGVNCAVDAIGEGRGVVDRLRELKNNGSVELDVIEWKNSRKAKNENDFSNKRVESYWELKQKFERKEIDLTRIDKKDYDKLCGELTELKLHPTSPMNSRGQMVLIAKKDLKHSPDHADMLAMLFGSGESRSVKDFYSDEFLKEKVAEF